MRRFEERFGVPILEGYGLSETSPVATFNRVDRPRVPGSIGLPVWGVEVGIVGTTGRRLGDGEPGEIVIRGHNVMKGYFGRPEATAQAIDRDGWFHTGDIGTRDADGYLYVVDRKKDMIIRGGFNVYPRELEEVLLHPPGGGDGRGDRRAARSARRGGQGGRASAPPAPASTEAELDRLVPQNHGRLQVPAHRRVRATALPMTATGKILKRELARQEQPEPAPPGHDHDAERVSP